MDYDKSYDLVDGLGIVAVVLVAAVLTGIASISLFGFTAAGTIATVAGFGISYAFVVGVGSLAGLMVYNDVGTEELGNAKDGKYSQQQEDFAGLVAGVVGLCSIEFIPQVQSFVAGSDVIAIIATVVVAIPAFVIVHRL